MSYLTFAESATPSTPSTGKATIFAPTATVPTIGVLNDAGVLGQLAFSAAGTLTFTPPTAWTPAVSFGGGTTGITYGTRSTNYTRIGNMLFAYGYMELTSKGSSTGTALMTGLPVAAVGTAGLIIPVVLRITNLTGITGMIVGYVAPSGQVVNLQYLGTGTATTMTDAHFTNTTDIAIMAIYQVT